MCYVNWRLGFEIELIAPRGLSRQTLAQQIAQQTGGSVRRFFHLQIEPSKVPEKPVFSSLTLGFEVIDREGSIIAKCVDDLTLQKDCNRSIPPKQNWYRIVSDDVRLLRLIAKQTSPESSLAEVLDPIAALFDTQTETDFNGMVKVSDESGASVAIAAPLPGERERPCELITPPIEKEHLHHLEFLLNIARSLDFKIPIEGAIHIHFDADPLCSSETISNLVNLLWAYGNNLKLMVSTNPNCRHLGTWPKSLIKVVQAPDFRSLNWHEAKNRLQQVGLTKYCDYNLFNLVEALPNKTTFEVRIFPVWLHGQAIMEAAGLFEAILKLAISPEPISYLPPQSWSQTLMNKFLQKLPLSTELHTLWQNRLESVRFRGGVVPARVRVDQGLPSC
jgi:hypothetical protein